eukprot:2503589-Prymnesium_polylepis.1
MHSGRWAEAAHFFRPNLAPNLKMLSSAHHRAGALDVGCQVCQRSTSLRSLEDRRSGTRVHRRIHRGPATRAVHHAAHHERAVKPDIQRMDGSAEDPLLA